MKIYLKRAKKQALNGRVHGHAARQADRAAKQIGPTILQFAEKIGNDVLLRKSREEARFRRRYIPLNLAGRLV
jgi:hypothetical protein